MINSLRLLQDLGKILVSAKGARRSGSFFHNTGSHFVTVLYKGNTYILKHAHGNLVL